MSGEDVKTGWRARLLAARAGLRPEQLAASAAAVERHLLDRLAGAGRVAAYVPVGREPGSLRLLDALRDRGTEVLLPIVVSGGLDWGRYEGAGRLAGGALGIRRPTGSALGAGVLADVDAVLVPALAADHRGVRLGRGGGYYDRALSVVDPGTAVVALLHDGELVRRLPADDWDHPVSAAVSPGHGWTELPVVEHHDS